MVFTGFLMKFLLCLLPPLICVAFFTLLERKILSIVGFRIGPNKVSFLGIFQPIGDAIKLSNKSVNILSGFSIFFYYFSSFLMMLMSLALFLCLSSSPSFFDLKFNLLLFLLFLGINSLNSIFSGWSCYSKYSLVGSIRTVAQLISYEAVLFLCIFFFVLVFNSFDLSCSLFYSPMFFGVMVIPCLYFWFPTMLAELNRTPFDFSEGESELVSGFNTEFGSGSFTLIFLAEYGAIVFFSVLSSLIFFFPFLSFYFFFFFFIIWVRSVLPRFRFDKLMYVSWKFFIPFLTFFYLFMVTYMV